ncbi:type I-E CRISPR-associated endonuclease Cas1e [Dehalococcoides sp. THU3]|uniref:type I-E CRISPR-associated endonuclease Cas1e n=1 Tax=Dehalococcoides TaxID=61434 RepID=UPI0005B56902|nr:MULTISPECIES: type I-E CRISPR-associated endonuclease Cas1e [Dehalococcoides]QYY58784.1 type I-E CRISPR-associated endonuclease Cas1e [Dehalococcoides mccartyi]BAQ35290.1 putative CRISPR-associated protein Cas1 [Dehalococcoides sp. UCH007]
MRTLYELPRFRDRWSYLYLEMGRLDVDADGLGFHQENCVVPVPIDQLGVVMLGPGSTVTHAAIKSLSQNNCLVAWTGQDGIRLYAASIGGTYSARRLIRQARLVSDEEKRLEVAWRMYRFRFNETIPPVVSLESIRGMEGIRVRRAYAKASQEYGVEWNGRHYDQKDWNKGDPINRALSAANACLYGICHAAILSAGYSSALGFVHTGKMLSFVYDIADLYKTELTIPVAFKIAAANPEDLERQVRMECREAFYKYKLLERLLPDIAEVLGVSDDIGEGPDEFEGRIVTLAVGTEDGSFSWEPERQGEG